MEWFTNWWEALSGLQQVLACFAIPATVLLVLQTILLLFTAGGHDADHGGLEDNSGLDAGGADGSAGEAGPDVQMDAGAEGDAAGAGEGDAGAGEGETAHDGAHHAAGVRIFTVRGLVAFFAVGGWLGLALLDLGFPAGGAVALGAVGGFLALLLVAFILKWALRLQENGALSLRNAVAHTGTCYITVPPRRTGSGKVTVMVQEQLVELEAVTDGDEAIRPGTQIQVTGLAGENLLVVRPLLLTDGGKSSVS